jgi:hypothetical protein
VIYWCFTSNCLIELPRFRALSSNCSDVLFSYLYAAFFDQSYFLTRFLSYVTLKSFDSFVAIYLHETASVARQDCDQSLVVPCEQRRGLLGSVQCGQIDEVWRVDVQMFPQWVVGGCLRIDLNALSVQFERIEVGVVGVSEHVNDVQFRHRNRLNILQCMRIIQDILFLTLVGLLTI